MIWLECCASLFHGGMGGAVPRRAVIEARQALGIIVAIPNEIVLSQFIRAPADQPSAT